MSAIEYLQASDTLIFPGVLFDPWATAQDLPPHINTGRFCVTKNPGELKFILTSSDFGLQKLLKVDTGFLFSGELSGNNIIWHVSLVKPFSAFGKNIHAAHGQITTRIDDAAAYLDTDCNGAQRVFEATMTTIGGNNIISLDFSGLGSAGAQNITIQDVAAGQPVPPVFFNVEIHPHYTGHSCFGAPYFNQTPGSTVRFTALVTNVQAVGNVTGYTYQWDVTGGVTIINGKDQPIVELKLDTPGDVSLTVKATLTTNIESGTRQVTMRFPVITRNEAELMAKVVELGCRWNSLHTLHQPPWIDPGDPFKNSAVVRRGYLLHELFQIRAQAESIVSAASAVTKQASDIIEYTVDLAEKKTGHIAE